MSGLKSYFNRRVLLIGFLFGLGLALVAFFTAGSFSWLMIIPIVFCTLSAPLIAWREDELNKILR